jgi:hypothetical protein
MSRAIRLTSSALVVVCALAGVAVAKPSIAVLGLEVIDKSGSPSNDDVTFAKNLTEGLRARAKIGGPYSIAPTGDKELIDLKLLKGCDEEKPACMAGIGGDLNADFLIYGSVTKRGKNYDISVNFLDVHAGKREKTVPTSLPVGTSGVALQTAAKKIYNGLTGQSDACTITIKTPGVDRATILVNGKEAGNITNGVGSVNGLSEGKYAVAIESTGFHRYTKSDVSCTGGETTNIQADMSKMDKAVIPPPNTVTDPNAGNGSGTAPGLTGQSGSESHPSGNKVVWKTMAYGGLVGAAIGGGIWVYGYSQARKGNDIRENDLTIPAGATAPGTMGLHYDDSQCGTSTGQLVRSANSNYDKACTGKTLSTAGIAITAGFGVISAIGFIALYMKSGSEEQPVSVAGHRMHHEPFAITPVVSPTGAGATFRMEW